MLTALALGWLISLARTVLPGARRAAADVGAPAVHLAGRGRAGCVVGTLARRRSVTLGLIVATSVASLAAFYTVPRYAEDDYRPLIAHTVEQGLPDDTVFCVYPWQVGYWRSYGNPDGPTARPDAGHRWSPAVSEALDAALARGRVWFPAHLALGAILETQIEAHLAERPCRSSTSGTGRTPGSARGPRHSADTGGRTGRRFAVPGSAAGAVDFRRDAAREPAPAANAVTPITLAWQADAAPPVLAVSLRLTDDLGQIWAQHDYEPLGGANCDCGRKSGSVRARRLRANRTPDSLRPMTHRIATDRLGLLIPAGTPPGRYHVELVIRPKGSDRAIDAVAPRRSLGPAVPALRPGCGARGSHARRRAAAHRGTHADRLGRWAPLPGLQHRRCAPHPRRPPQGEPVLAGHGTAGDRLCRLRAGARPRTACPWRCGKHLRAQPTRPHNGRPAR